MSHRAARAAISSERSETLQIEWAGVRTAHVPRL